MRRTRGLRARLLLIAMMFCGVALHAATITQAELARRTQELMDSVVPGDKTPWQKYYADDCLFFDEKGRSMNKAKLVADIAPLPKGYSGSIRLANVQSRIIGDTAILSYDLDESETIWGQELKARYHATDTWMNRDGRWQIVATQVLRYYEDPAPGRADPAKFAEFAGTYELTPGTTITVTAEGDQLYAERTGRPREKLIPEAPEIFFRPGVEGRRLFRYGADGKVDALIDRRNNEDVIWKRVVARPVAAAGAPPEVGKPLPGWSRGMLDIHQLSTGRGNAAFFVFPDGTTMIVDAGAVGDGTKIAGTDQRPDDSRTTGAWIARYIERAMAPATPHLDYALLTHFHADHMGQLMATSAPSKSGAFKLTGITEVGERIPIDTVIDRGTSYLPPQDDAMMKNYHAFLADQQTSRGMKAETIRVGRADQIALRHDRAAFPGFEVRSVAANGVVWTGQGDGTRPIFPSLSSIFTAEDRPTENMCSIGLRIGYGKFSYFTGGDMPGVPDAGSPAWHSVEDALAGVVGPADVHVVNHHGSIDPESAVFLSALRSPVMILPAWSLTHPSQDSLKRMLTMRLYPGPHDVFVTTLREPAKASIGSRVDQLKAQHGHIVVRVEPGGDRYRVFVLDDMTDDAKVVAVFGPYSSHTPSRGLMAEVKAPIKGLVSMGAYKFVSQGGSPVNTLDPLLAKPGIFGGIVIVAAWKDLQSKTSDITNYTVIDEALKAVRSYNRQYSATPLAVKLRVWGGFEAPEWAKQLDNGPITVMFGGKQRTIGPVWSSAYRRAWREFQKLLADKYDSEPLVHEVSVTSCMLLTAEPFVVPTDAPSQQKLRAAGFSDAKFQWCLREAVADYDDWKSTRIEFPFNPFRLTDDPKKVSLDYHFTFDVMRACRERIGERCTLDNHDLVVPPLTTIVPLYAEMQKLGGAIEFQTFNETPKFYAPTISYGAGLGAGSIELWQDFQGFPCVPAGQLKNWASFFGSQENAKNGEPACVAIPK